MNQDETPDEAAIRKLPQWAQKCITGLRQERDTAVRALNEHLDGQTKSKIYWEEYLCTGEAKAGPSSKRFYVQTDRLTIENAGVHLEVSCHDGDSMHDCGIEMKWSDAQSIGGHIALVPKSFQQVVLIAPHNMRRHEQRHVESVCQKEPGHAFIEVQRCTNCGQIR